MNIKTILITVILSLLISSAALFVYHKSFATKTAYIDIKKVFNGFQMKSELEQKYKGTEKERSKILDSLAFNLKVMSKHLNELETQKKTLAKEEINQFEYTREKYLKLKEQFGQDNAVLSQKYDDQILAQLTQYIMEYGKQNNYDIILGADGNGSLMYSKEAHDISEEVIIFINNKYKGID
jgi:outer membrane protein